MLKPRLITALEAAQAGLDKAGYPGQVMGRDRCAVAFGQRLVMPHDLFSVRIPSDPCVSGTHPPVLLHPVRSCGSAAG